MALLRIALTVTIVLCCPCPKQARPDYRSVRRGILTSTAFPKIRIKPATAFRYIGKFDFTVQGMAQGERYVFAETRGRRIKKLFILQFEEILAGSSQTYNYSFKDALTLSGYKFRQNTFAFSNRQGKQENPAGEGVLTADFLERKGYLLEDELMASRFVTVPDAERKHELIIFYIENVSESEHSLKDFYEGDNRTPLWEELSKALTKRSFESFEILN